MRLSCLSLFLFLFLTLLTFHPVHSSSIQSLVELDSQLDQLLEHLQAESPAEQLLEQDVPPPPHHASRQHASEVEDIEQSLAESAREFDKKEDTSLLESETAHDSALNMEAEVDTSVPLSAEQTALLTKPFRLPDLSAGLPVEYMHPPISFNLDSERQDKLQNALNTVVNVAKGKMTEIVREKKWGNKVQKLINELSTKKLKVENHLSGLSEQIRKYLMKKKKIQNAILQKKLGDKLKQTHKNLKRIRRYTFGLTKQEFLYQKHKEELSHAVENLQHSLALLKGIKRKRNYDLPKRGTAQKLLDGYSKLDPDFSTKAMEEQKEVEKLTAIERRKVF